jgi:hypothetical protein
VGQLAATNRHNVARLIGTAMCTAHIAGIMGLCTLACIGVALTHGLERLCGHARQTEPSTLWLLLARAPRHGDAGPGTSDDSANIWPQRWWSMEDPTLKKHRQAHIAYCERALRSLLELLQSTCGGATGPDGH